MGVTDKISYTCHLGFLIATKYVKKFSMYPDLTMIEISLLLSVWVDCSDWGPNLAIITDLGMLVFWLKTRNIRH